VFLSLQIKHSTGNNELPFTRSTLYLTTLVHHLLIPAVYTTLKPHDFYTMPPIPKHCFTLVSNWEILPNLYCEHLMHFILSIYLCNTHKIDPIDSIVFRNTRLYFTTARTVITFYFSIYYFYQSIYISLQCYFVVLGSLHGDTSV